MKPTVIDLFAGVGGFSLGFEQAGFDIVLANEYDKSIAHAYSENRPGIPMIVEDITRLSIGETFDRFRGKTTVIIGGLRARVSRKRESGRVSTTPETSCSDITSRSSTAYARNTSSSRTCRTCSPPSTGISSRKSSSFSAA